MANLYRDSDKSQQDLADIAYAFQEAVVDTIYIKCRRALEQTGHKSLVVSGGVSANISLRVKLSGLLESNGGKAYYPRLKFCTDNGAMIAYAGYCRYQQIIQQQGLFEEPAVRVQPRWPIADLV